MSEAMPPPPPKPAAAGGRWAYVPAILLCAMLAGLGTLAKIAMNDPGFAVEKDYYQKAVSWDAKMAQQTENERLGIQVDLSAEPGLLRVRLRDRVGAAIDGANVTVEAFHNARAGQITSAELTPLGGGRYEAELGLARPGLWEFRLRVRSAEGTATAVVRQQVQP